MTTRDGDGGYRLPRDLPTGWKAKEIILVELSFQQSGGRLSFTSSPIYPFHYDANGVDPAVFEAFVKDCALNGLPTTLPSPRPTQERRTPLDIVVRNPCHVVVLLNRTLPWRFRSSGPAITTKSNYGRDNCRVKHLRETGEILPDDGPGRFQCQTAYFSVLRRGYFERQRFNFHVEFDQGPRMDGSGGNWPPLEVAIDPDVPDDGGGFPASPWRSPYEDY